MNKYVPEVWERMVRPLHELRGEYPSLWAAVESIAIKIGCAAQTVLDSVKGDEGDGGQRDGPTTSERGRLKQLESQKKALRRTNQILKMVSAFFD